MANEPRRLRWGDTKLSEPGVITADRTIEHPTWRKRRGVRSDGLEVFQFETGRCNGVAFGPGRGNLTVTGERTEGNVSARVAPGPESTGSRPGREARQRERVQPSRAGSAVPADDIATGTTG